MKYFRRFARHIREGFIGVKRHFAMAFSSASAITITLLLVGVFAAFAANLAMLTKEIEQSISLVALVDYSVTDSSSITSIQQQIESIDTIDRIEFRTKDEEFDFYNENYPEMVEFSELYRDDNPFHDAFIIYLKDGTDMETTKVKVDSIPGISSVEDGGANTYTLITILHTIRNVGAIIIMALVALAVYLIYNTIKITIAARKDEIWIMRNVGAKNGYIRAPFLVEGVIIGIIGSIIPIIIVMYGYKKLYDYTSGSIMGIINLIPTIPFILYLGGGLLLIGVLVGFIGSYISVCRYLRVTR